MSEELSKLSMIAKSITNYYQELENLIYEDLTRNEEYEEIIKRIQELIEYENEEYAKVNLETIKTYFKQIHNKDESLVKQRIQNRLNERLEILTNEPQTDDGKLLSNIIDAKIMIDTLKIVEKRIENIKQENIHDPRFKTLIQYYESSKLTYLTNTSYLENIALKNSFDIKNIEEISIDKINNEFNIDLIRDFSNMLQINILTGLTTLKEINTYDEILNTYLALTELSRIEALLSYLDKNNIEKILEVYKFVYGDSKEETMTTANALIRKRKKELEN